MKLFSGLTRAYGQYDLTTGDKDINGKHKGRATTIRANLLPDHYARHLRGENSEDALGVVPIQDGNAVDFGAIDLDEYLAPQRETETEDEFDQRREEFETQLYVRVNKIIYDNNLPLTPCRSKSGGMHIFAFCAKPFPASMVKKRLEEIAAELGYADSEVFPKQNNISPDGVGNWINLPFFDHEQTERYGWNVETGESIKDLDAWLDYAEGRKLTARHFNTISVKNVTPTDNTQARPLLDGPPCLQKLLERGVEDLRNVTTYNLGVYLNRKYPGDDQAISEHMMKMQQDNFTTGLPDHEVNQVLGQVALADKKHYQCTTAPLVGMCNRKVCVQRKYGIGSGEVNLEFSFGSLWHVIPRTNTGEELWNDSVYRLQLTLDTEDHELELDPPDLLKYNTIRTEGLYRGVLLPNLDAEDWIALMSDKLNEAKAKNQLRVYVTEEVTPIGELRTLLEEFLDMYANATEKRLISASKAWHNVDESEYWLLTTSLPAFLKRRRFSEISGVSLNTTLRKHFGMKPGRRRLREGAASTTRLWIFPENLLPTEMREESDDDSTVQE